MAEEELIETEVARIVPDSVEQIIIKDIDYQEEEDVEWIESAATTEVTEKKKDKEKEKKKTKGKKKKRTNVQAEAEEEEERAEPEPALKLAGVEVIKIRGITQKLLGCVVGENVTTEAPWIVIDKDKIEETMLKHDESSEFLPIRDQLELYKSSNILLGYDPDFEPIAGEDQFRFYIAVTEEARETIVERLKEERRIQEEILKNSIHKSVLPWTSYGSEKDVDESITFNSRPFIELELEADVDTLLRPTKFEDRNVDDAKDGYVKIGPGRAEFDGVKKLRVDAACQAVPTVTGEAAQTDPGLPKNVWTQYVYDLDSALASIPKPEGRRDQPPKKEEFVFQEQAYMDSALEYNETFDLYLNDYPLLVLKEEDSKVKETNMFEEYQAFVDIGNCKGKFVSAIAWHPMWTGTVALAYVRGVRSLSALEDPLTMEDTTTRDVFNKSPVLVWSFKDYLKPRLILEAPREITCLSWCPTDPNILVGGSVSGQILVWDIKGKLAKVEESEYLTLDLQRYRLVMYSLLGWMKPQPPARIVTAAAISHGESSHKAKITHLCWLSPYYEFTSAGTYKADPKANTKQFATCSEGGRVFIWNLNAPLVEDDPETQERKKRLRKRPSALTMDFSIYKPYDRKMRPVYQFFPPVEFESKTLCLTAFDSFTHSVNYRMETVGKEVTFLFDRVVSDMSVEGEEPAGEQVPGVATSVTSNIVIQVGDENQELQSYQSAESVSKPKVVLEEEPPPPVEKESEEIEVEDLFVKREVFKPFLEFPTREPEKLFCVATENGEVLHLGWEGYEFHRGEKITTENLVIKGRLEGIHDSPVIFCGRSPFIDDLILTVGGRVYALWKVSMPENPVFWKLGNRRTTCGMWSPFKPAMFFIGNEEGSISIWDFSIRSDKEVLNQVISGSALTCLSYHSLPVYGGRSILGVGDYNNSFRMFFFPPEFQTTKPGEKEWMQILIEKEMSIRQYYTTWSEVFIKQFAEELRLQKEAFEAAAKEKAEQEKREEEEAQARAKLEEEETRRLRGYQGPTDPIREAKAEKLKEQQEVYMQKVLLEKKGLNRDELMIKQAPIIQMQKMDEEKKKKQKEKIRQQQKIFDKTIAMFFPDVIDIPPEGPSKTEELQEELMEVQNMFMEEYEETKDKFLEHTKKNPFVKRFKWEKLFEEGRKRRSVLDFSLFLRQKREIRYLAQKKEWMYAVPESKRPAERRAPKKLPSRGMIIMDDYGGEEGGWADSDSRHSMRSDMSQKRSVITVVQEKKEVDHTAEGEHDEPEPTEHESPEEKIGG